jgi:3-oxoacyl-[acyl-carrier protein] reductase
VNESKVVVVTGGASGIGAGCVRHFIAQGWRVVVNYFLEGDKAAAEALVAGGKGIAVQGDVSRDEDCRAIAAQAEAAFGRIDALVSSAGASRLVPHAQLDALTLDDFLRTTAVNTAGPFQIARACAPALTAGAGGAIVIISSYGAIFGTGSSIAYAASKGATNTLTMSLARVLAPKVRCQRRMPSAGERRLRRAAGRRTLQGSRREPSGALAVAQGRHAGRRGGRRLLACRWRIDDHRQRDRT